MLGRPAGAIVLVALFAGPLAAQSTDVGVQVVRAASNTYLNLTNFQAEFRQHFDDKAFNDPDGRGTLYQEGKSRFAMRFSDPAGDAIVADGSHLWMYLPSTSPGKVLRFSLPNHPTYSTDLLGTFLDNAADRYRISYVRAESIDGHMTDAVIMEPTSSDLPFRRATIWFDRESHLPRRLEIEESRDHKRILELHNLQSNRSIPPSTFVCNPPKGVKTIDQ